MSNDHRDVQELILISPQSCTLDAGGHCITCSDEAVQVRVLSIDCDTGVALVESGESTEEVDISLVEEVVPGDMLLVHGGVAIASFKEGE
jgi:hydrogenase maturation factor